MSSKVTFTGVNGPLRVQDWTASIMSRKNAKYLEQVICCILSWKETVKYNNHEESNCSETRWLNVGARAAKFFGNAHPATFGGKMSHEEIRSSHSVGLHSYQSGGSF
jgi:hypothetical protein